MPKILNLTGSKFGRLSVVGKQGLKWLCLCECGNTTAVISASLRNGNTKSCGCIAKEKSSKRLSQMQSSLRSIPTGTTPSVEQLRALLEYDEQAGCLLWRRTVNPRAKAGDVAGSQSMTNGYKTIGIGGRNYRQHRVIWALVHGHWPDGEIDHINGDKEDNRIKNLRAASRAKNAQNERKPRKSSSTGVMGVSKKRGKFRAEIRANGQKLSLGSFDSATDAGAAYLKAKRLLHEGCTI